MYVESKRAPIDNSIEALYCPLNIPYFHFKVNRLFLYDRDMSRTAKIAKNTLVQVIGRAIGTVLGILTLGVMTRYLGTAGYGQFTTVTTFLQFFGIFVDFGLSLTTLSMLSEKGADKDKITSNMLSLRIISAAVFFGFAPLVVLAFPYDAAVKAGVAIAAFSFFFLAINQILTAVLQKELRMERVAIAEVLGRGGLFAGALGVAFFGLSLQWMLGALVLGNAVTILANWLLVRKLHVVRPRFDWPVWKDIFTQSWPIGLAIVFNLIYLKGDVIILSLTRTQEEVGLYGAAYKILDVVTVVPIMFMGLVLPLLVKARSEKSKEDWNRILQKAFDFMAVLALPLVAGGIAVGPELMQLFAGDQFDGAGSLLQVLVIAAGAVFFASLFGHAVIAIKKQKPMVWGYAADAVLATVLYLTFIPRYGADAAAWITVTSEVFIAFATFFMVWSVTRFAPKLWLSARALVNALLMIGFIYLLPDMHVMLKVLFGALVYAILTIALGTVPAKVLKDMLPSRGSVDFGGSSDT